MNALFSLIDKVEAWLATYRHRRMEARTRRFLNALPEDIRKDIGWPVDTTAIAPLSPIERPWNADAVLALTASRSS